MKLYLVRHGLTNYNEAHLCNNDPAVDVHLTETGIAQVNLLADKLRDVPLQFIYTSQLKRTKQTASIINQFHNLPILEDDRLGDTITGFEGKPTSLYFDALDQAVNRWTFKYSGGESLEELKQRVREFITELSLKDYECGLIVTSQYIIYAFLCWLDGLSNEEAWSTEVAQGSVREIQLSHNWQ